MRKLYVIFAIFVICLMVTQAFIPTLYGIRETSTETTTDARSYNLQFIKLWEDIDVNYCPTFMAGFLDAKEFGEFLVVFSSARGDVSGRYVSMLQASSTYDTAYIFDVKEGNLVKSITGTGTYYITFAYVGGLRVLTYKVWDRYGFFDPSGNWMVEDPAYYGTNARVIDVSDPYKLQYNPSEVIYQIEWGFNDITQGNFSYAMLTDNGKYLVVGYPAGGYVLVFKRDDIQKKYVFFQKVVTISSGEPRPDIGFGAHFYVTPDGRYLIVGYRDYPQIELFYKPEEEYLMYGAVKFYYLPYYIPKNVSGFGSSNIVSNLGGILAIDPTEYETWSIGEHEPPYVMDGVGAGTGAELRIYLLLITKDGWGIAGYIDSATILSIVDYVKLFDSVSYVSPTISRSLIGYSSNVMAMVAQSSDTAKLYIYDLVGNKTYLFNHTVSKSPVTAVAVDPNSEYIFGANAMWKVVQRTEYTGMPRLRLEGHMWFNTSDFYIKDSSAYIPPAPSDTNWTASIMSGDIEITRARIVPDEILLVSDDKVKNARFRDMFYSGYIGISDLIEVGGHIDARGILPDETVDEVASKYNADPSKILPTFANFTIDSLYGWNGSGFGGATVSYVTMVNLPFDRPVYVEQYDELTIVSDFAIATVAPIFDGNNDLKGLYRIVIPASSAATVYGTWAIAKELASQVVYWTYGTQAATVIAGTSIGAIASGVCAVVGLAFLIDAFATLKYREEAYSSVRSLVMMIPIVETPDGKKYGVVVMALPQDEIENAGGEYITHAQAIAEKLGLDDIEVVFKPFGANWEEYRGLIEAGHIPEINLKDAIEDTLVEKYGYNIKDLKITKAKLVVETLAHGKVGFWDWIKGGIKIPVVTVISGVKIDIVGRPDERVYTNPSDIKTLVDSITVRFGDTTQVAQLITSTRGLKASFVAPVGTSINDFSISFGKKVPFTVAVDFSLRLNMYLEQPMEEVGGYMYKSYFVFSWKGTEEFTPQLHLDAVGFIDMPYPLTKAVRVAIYSYGTDEVEFTQYLELSSLVEDPESPSGYRYTYMTTRNTLFLDPRNGALLQPSETFIFKYFYGELPDVSVEILLNGTDVTSTIPKHAMVGIHSTKISQNVGVRVLLEVYLKEDNTKTLITSRAYEETIYVQSGRTEWLTYDIADLVDLAITTMRTQNKVAQLEVTAEIIDYVADEDPTNNRVTQFYIPPTNLPYGTSESHTVTVFAYDAITGQGVSGATITLSIPNVGSWSGTTNSTGYATITVPYVRYYNITVSHPTYNAPPLQVYIYKDGTVLVPLVSGEITVNPPLNDSQTPPISIGGTNYYWLSIFVAYKDAFPHDDAQVVIYDQNTLTKMFDLNTGLSGYVHVLIPENKYIRYVIDVTNPQDPTQTSHAERTFTMTQHYMFSHSTSWSSTYYTPEVYLDSASFLTSRGQGYYDAPVKHNIMLYIWTNYPQTVEVKLDVYNVDDPNNPVYVSSEYENITLVNGFNTIYAWVDISAPNGGYFKVKATIVSYEADTDTTNNEVWTNTQYLKPEVDYIVSIRYSVIQRKVDWAVLPEDKVQISIVIKSMNTNVSLPLDLSLTIKKRDWGGVLKEYQNIRQTITAYGDVVYKNLTITVPWTDKLIINVTATHPWDDKPWNNIAGVVIDIFPDAKVSMSLLPVATEGSEITVRVQIISNVMQEGYTIGLAVRDNSTNTLLGFSEIELKPEVIVDLNYTVPNNPEMFMGIRYPSLKRTFVASISGDFYDGNNWSEAEVTVLSSQAFTAILIIAIIFALLLFVRILKDTIEDTNVKRYVKRKPKGYEKYLKDTIEEGSGKFVRRRGI